MLLAIDAGNTNMVFAVFDGRRKIGAWRISTDARRTPDEYVVWLTQLLSLENLTRTDIDAAVLGSVVPMATRTLVRLCQEHFGCNPMVVSPTTVDLGLEIGLANPREAGADRLLNAIAALERYSPPLVVVDFGTGTNFDVVDAERRYIGGIIAPGPNLALDALHRVAAQLPKVEITMPETVIGRGTVPAMQSGMFWGYVSMIEGLLTRICAELSPGGDPPVSVIATGGMAGVFRTGTNMIHDIDAELTLRGLLLVYERNKVT